MSSVTLGSALTGAMINVFLHGVLVVQTYDYFMNFQTDKLSLKMVVHGLFVLENVQTAMILYISYKTFGTGTYSMSDLSLLGFSSDILAAIVAFIAHSFYAYRIYVLSRRWWLAGIVLLLTFVQLVLGMIIGIHVLRAEDLVSLAKLYAISVTWFGLSAWCDIIIAVSMVALLHKSNTGFSASTRRILKRAIRLSIETGAITAGMAVACVVLIVSFPTQPYYSAISIAVPKWYSNTLLAQLNSRTKYMDESAHLRRVDQIEFAQDQNCVSGQTARSQELTSIWRSTVGTNVHGELCSII